MLRRFVAVLLVLPARADGERRFVDDLDERRSRMFFVRGIASGEWGKNLATGGVTGIVDVVFWQPFSWSWGQYKPTVNEYSWTNLSSMLYIEQPVGTGYSQGTPNIKNEDDLAAQFVGFLQQFLEVFPELKGKKTYLTGESVRFESSFPGLWILNAIRASL
jgi:hypothetical protein